MVECNWVSAEQGSEARHALPTDHADLNACFAGASVRQEGNHSLLNEIHMLDRVAGREQDLVANQLDLLKVRPKLIEFFFRQSRQQPASERRSDVWHRPRCALEVHPFSRDLHYNSSLRGGWGEPRCLARMADVSSA